MEYRYIIMFIVLLAIPLWGQVAVIAHKDVPVDDITKTLLYDFYSGDIQKWENGEEVIVLDLKPKSETKDEFYEFLGTSTSRMKSIWLKKMLAGEKDPPASCESEEKMITKIAKTPGSIGFISNENLTNEVKLLLVIEVD